MTSHYMLASNSWVHITNSNPFLLTAFYTTWCWGEFLLLNVHRGEKAY